MQSQEVLVSGIPPHAADEVRDIPLSLLEQAHHQESYPETPLLHSPTQDLSLKPKALCLHLVPSRGSAPYEGSS